jgi:hypothetical protein
MSPPRRVHAHPAPRSAVVSFGMNRATTAERGTGRRVKENGSAMRKTICPTTFFYDFRAPHTHGSGSLRAYATSDTDCICISRSAPSLRARARAQSTSLRARHRLAQARVRLPLLPPLPSFSRGRDARAGPLGPVIAVWPDSSASASLLRLTAQLKLHPQSNVKLGAPPPLIRFAEPLSRRARPSAFSSRAPVFHDTLRYIGIAAVFFSLPASTATSALHAPSTESAPAHIHPPPR